MAKEFDTIIRVGMNSTSMEQSTAEINRKIRVLDSSFKAINSEAKSFGETTETLQKKQDVLSQKIQLQVNRVEKLKNEYEKSKEETGENSRATEQLATRYNNAVASLTKMEGELKKTTEALEEQAKETTEATNKLQEFSDKAKSIGESMTKAGDSLIKLSAPIVGLGLVTGKMAMDFEDAMAKVSTIVDTTEVDIKSMGDSVMVLSDKYGQANGIIAEALYQTLSAGVEATESIGFLDVATKNSIAGFTDAATSVDTLTNIINAYALETSEALDVSDKLLVLQNFGKTTIGEFGDSIGRVSALASQSNISVEELFSSIAVLTRNGIQSTESITAMRQVISNIIKPSSEASKAAEELGIRFNASALQAKGFDRFLQDIMTRSRGNKDALIDLFGSVNALNAMMVLTSEKGAKDFQTSLDLMANSTGQTDEALEKLNTTGMQYRQTIEQMKNSFTDLGESMLPIITLVLNVVQTLTAIFSKLNPTVFQTIVILGMMLMTIGTILSTVGRLITSISTITTAFTGMGIGINMTVGKVLLLVGALTALAAIIAIIMGRSKDMERTFNNIGNMGNPNMQNYRPPRYARGTNYHPGGLAIVGEEGAELVDLPRGSKVYTNRKTQQILSDGDGGGDTFVFNVNMNDIDDLIEYARQQRDKRRFARMGEVPV